MKIQNFKTTVNAFSENSLVNYYFNKQGINQLIDNEYVKYQNREIFKNLTNIVLSGGDVLEDINTHYREYIKSFLGNNVPNTDTTKLMQHFIASFKTIIILFRYFYLLKQCLEKFYAKIYTFYSSGNCF